MLHGCHPRYFFLFASTFHTNHFQLWCDLENTLWEKSLRMENRTKCLSLLPYATHRVCYWPMMMWHLRTMVKSWMIFPRSPQHHRPRCSARWRPSQMLSGWSESGKTQTNLWCVSRIISLCFCEKLLNTCIVDQLLFLNLALLLSIKQCSADEVLLFLSDFSILRPVC